MNESTTTPERPVRVFRQSGIETAIWRRSSNSGAWYQVTQKRSYKKKDTDQWEHTQFIPKNLIPVAAFQLQQAYNWIDYNEDKE